MIIADASFVLNLLCRPSSITADALPESNADWHAPTVLATQIVSGQRGLLLDNKIRIEDARVALDDDDALAIRTWPVDTSMRM